MSRDFDTIRAVVVKLIGEEQRPWVAACMSTSTWEIIDDVDWTQWKNEALALVLMEPAEYEQREVELRIPQDQLDELFSGGSIDAEVRS